MRVIAHGGAGSSPDEPTARQAVIDEAVVAGTEQGSPVDAVIETVRRLEAAPQFNAGVGSAVQSDGRIRTDAGVMRSDRKAGAACSMPGVKAASEVARLVMEETPHVLLAGEHCVGLADAFDIETDCDLWTERTEERWNERNPPDPASPREQLDWLQTEFGGTDTVGSVATDGDRAAVCTSTGGRWCALAGRVGDVPQIGSGFYCTHAGGASATGHGEEIARVTLSRRAVDHLELGRDPQDAAELAIEEFAELTDGLAGVIVMDNKGSVGTDWNTESMQTSVAGGLTL